MESYLHQNEAYRMLHKYGQEQALKEAENHFNSYRDEINRLKFYDREKIDSAHSNMGFWLSVRTHIKLYSHSNKTIS